MNSRLLIVSVAVCLLALMSGTSASLYGANSPVINLSVKDFAQVFDNHVWMVEFYAPWCGHCKQLAPQWEAAAKNLKGLVRFAAVNCDLEENKQLAGLYGIRGFPTIKVFGAEHAPNPYQAGKPFKEPVDYNGQRTARDIAAFALKQLPSKHITSLSSEKAITSFVTENVDMPKVVLFSKKATSSNLYRALSLDFRGRMALAQANVQQSTLYEVDSSQLPVVLVFPVDGEPVRYQGSIEHASLHKFLDTYALARRRASNGEEGTTSAGASAAAAAAPPPLKAEAPQLLDQAAFEEKCTGHAAGVCVIGVMDPRGTSAEEQARYEAIMQALSEEYTKFFRFSWLDGSRFPGFCEQFGITSGFPALVVYSPSKQLQTPYIGAFNQESISSFLASVMRGKKRSFPLADVPTLVPLEE
eukprot:CAMPEP_0177650950 /NCGR_PEP_ID=MMETSP0447-20121125/12247_1 /TAXON_ID=0 /ORGANISM="Stygamoeba regulata, Strain BSH-02190019" /LENGTH=413 /DNA_ID=CAMNT_0019153917 /DNA_START=27 /DNA_END=1268 /DNA_ORIENTATION=+